MRGPAQCRGEAGRGRLRGPGRPQALEQSGVRLLVCGTCLNHFQLLEAKQVGETTNMLDIVTAMQLADKVITLT